MAGPNDELETLEAGGQPETVQPAAASYDDQDLLWFPEESIITHEVVNDLDCSDGEVQITHEIVNLAWPEEEYPSHQDWYEVRRDVAMNISN